jgi:hypothetical protein
MTSIDRDLASNHTPIPAVVWLSFASSALAWMFDAMDLTIFLLVLHPSVGELIGSNDAREVAASGASRWLASSLPGGLGGIAFGIVAVQRFSPGDSGRAIAAIGQAFMLANAGAVFAIFPLLWLNRALGRRWSYALVVIVGDWPAGRPDTRTAP